MYTQVQFVYFVSQSEVQHSLRLSPLTVSDCHVRSDTIYVLCQIKDVCISDARLQEVPGDDQWGIINNFLAAMT